MVVAAEEEGREEGDVRLRSKANDPGDMLESMNENHDFIETQPSWFAPWRWHHGLWIVALLIWPLLYVVSATTLEHLAGQKPGWRCTVANIVNAPLEPIRKRFRRTATLPNPLYIPSKCDVCGEVDIFRFWERVPGDFPAIRLRRFCSQHHREFLDASGGCAQA